jgi:DNA-binding Xre family transcriptional regulator
LGRIVSKARQVRLDYQQRIGRSVSIQEVADAIGITRAALSNIEHGKTKQVEYETLRKLCEFYGVLVGDLLVYEDRRTLRLAAA